jgi:hypothetical protein
MYNSSSPNNIIMNAYCLENNRYMTDDNCNQYVINNTLANAPASDPIKSSILNYCGQTPAAGSVANWTNAKCQNYIQSVYGNDQAFWDKYCITNGNVMTDYATCKPNYMDSNYNPISGRSTIDFSNTVYTACAANDLWKTSSTCNTIMNDFSKADTRSPLNAKIIDTCKVGGTDPTAKNCATLYNTSLDPTIQQSYCTDMVNGAPRFINDPTCTTWAGNNQNNSLYQSEVVNYCGANSTNWNSANCNSFLTTASKATVPTGSDPLDHQMYDKYCITNKNLLTDPNCQTYYGTDGSKAAGKEYNDALKSMCKDNWKTNANCSTTINNDATLLADSDLNSSIINACKAGAPSPIPAGCVNLYTNNSFNDAIKKSYCTDIVNGVPRFISDTTCYTWGKGNQNDSTYQSELVGYCGTNKDTWNNTNCKAFLNTAPSATVPSGSDTLDKQLYDAYCLTNMNSLNDYNTCKTRYGEDSSTDSGKKFTDAMIKSCTQTGGVVDNAKLFSTTSCITDTSVTTPPAYLTSAIYESKVNYCNSPTTFTNDNCKVFIPDGANVGRFDSMLKTNCINTTNSTKDPCLTVSSATYPNSNSIPQYGKALNDSCIDTNGMFTPTDICISRNIPSSPYYYNLMEPTMKYCGSTDATTKTPNITNKVCTDYMSGNISRSATAAGCPIKSSFRGDRYDSPMMMNKSGCWYNNMILLILMIVIVVLVYKHSEKMYSMENPINMLFLIKKRDDL